MGPAPWAGPMGSVHGLGPMGLALLSALFSALFYFGPYFGPYFYGTYFRPFFYGPYSRPYLSGVGWPYLSGLPNGSRNGSRLQCNGPEPDPCSKEPTKFQGDQYVLAAG